MKKTKIVTLLAVSALSAGLLAACSSNNTSSSSASSSSAASSSAASSSAAPADVYAGATAGTTDFASLQKGFAANGAWLNAITADVDATGKTLTVDGIFAGDGQLNRKLALYSQNANFQVTKRFTLTVDKIEVNSPNFYISNGTVKGDVYVNAPGFYGQSGKMVDGTASTPEITGKLVFASADLKTAYDTMIAATPAKAVKVDGGESVGSGTVVAVSKGAINIAAHGNVTYINQGSGADVTTGATAGTTSLDTFTKALSPTGTWIVAVTSGSIDATGKTIVVDGNFVGADNAMARKIALYNQNANHQVTVRTNLMVGKLIIKSPQTYIANGIVKGDVYVAAGPGGKSLNFHAQNGKDTSGAMVKTEIDGNLYFASQADMAAYQKLPATQQFQVNGTVGVQATPAN